MSVKLSVIVPTLNESRVIEHTLQKIQSFGPHEIIVGDGGSCDETCAIAEKMGAKTVQAPKGRASQMNAVCNP